MKIPFLKPALAMGSALILASCGSGSPKIVSTPIANIDSIPLKIDDLTETQLKGWGGADLVTDTIPGMSVEKAYSEIIKNNKGQKTIVAVIDSGVDIEHEDLEGVLWTNTDEIPGNGKDDDNNGYIDDVHGWNFLGDAVKENMEYTRIYKRLKPKYEGKTPSSISTADRAEFIYYQEAKQEYEKEYQETVQNRNQYEQIKKQLVAAHQAVSSQLGKENYTIEELNDMQATGQMAQYKAMLQQIQNNVNENIPEALEELDEGIAYYDGRLDTHFNLELDGRAPVGDDPYDITDTKYGNGNVMGPDPEKEDLKHGTHVAGIIAAERNKNIGIIVVANNVEIMAIPSFGKYFSPNPEWVIEAIKYAEKNDVLIVNAGGNESLNLDENTVYPNDQNPEAPQEIANNFLTVGALNFDYGAQLLANFSNYGKTNVDVFAPGTKIWSTTPNNEYEYLQGTSMAAPAVAGVAAIIRSFYPKLSAAQVKQIIMDSGLTTNADVVVGGDRNNVQDFKELSKSGKMVNLYNALILASQTK